MSSNLFNAWRTLTRRPAYFALASVTLALGIAANLTLFSLLDAIYFRPLPLRESGRLVRVASTSPKAFLGLVSYLESGEIAESVSAFEDVVPVGQRGVTLHRGGESQLLLVDYVSPTFFGTLGIPLELGRGFDASDSSTPQVVVNHRLWQERLGADPDLIGSSVQLNDRLFTVVGVTARGFVGLDRVVQTDLFIPVEQAPLVVSAIGNELSNRSQRWFELFARLAPSSTGGEAQAQLDALARRWAAEDPQQYGEGGLVLHPLEESRREAIREGAAFLALPALVLFIACANVANLLLARNEARSRERAIQVALGAGRRALFGQASAESLLLTSCGALLGMLTAAWWMGLVSRLVPPGPITYTLDLRLDARLLVFGMVLVLVSTSLITFASASRAASEPLVSTLRGERSSPGRLGRQHVLVAVQMAIGVMVLAAASLVVRSLFFSASLRPGFDSTKEVATLYIVPGLKGYSRDATYRLLEQARESLSALASVQRVSYGIRLPAQGNEAGWASEFVVPGKDPPPGEESFRIRYTMVGPDYFEVMGTRILAGRGVVASDTPQSEPVAIVNRTMAERLFESEDPLGKVIFMGGPNPTPRRIVGVAEDIKIADLYEEPEMYVYVPFAQDLQSFGLLLLETDIKAQAVLPAARAEIARLAPDLPVLMTGSFALHMQTVLYEERRDAWIAAGTAALALLLTTVGLYGLVSLVTNRRTREIGVRMVLGAGRREIVRMVIGRGLALAFAGAVAGVLGGAAAARFLENRLHGIDGRDPWSFALAAGIVIAVSFLACLIPALRAASLDPATTTRAE
jgi:predicted permease